MAKLRSSSSSGAQGKKKMMKLNSLAEMLQRSLSLVRPSSKSVPEDVKEGHFAVTAVDGTRFVVPLTCLANPTFRRLLEMAAEEYGFDGHRGALTLPCRPDDLHRILDGDDYSSWPACYNNNANNMVQSY